jgi:hypothetical protein
MMKFILLALLLFFVTDCFAQSNGKILISGIVISPDSVPIVDVDIINTRTGITVRTRENGFFQTEISSKDSLLAYHISFKKQFISERNNGKYIVLEPEVQELLQVDIIDKQAQEQNNLNQTMKDIQDTPIEKPTGYELKSRQNYFIEEHGSHNQGFSPFFGPTAHIPLSKIAQLITSGIIKQSPRKKLTSHYHLVKRKK